MPIWGGGGGFFNKVYKKSGVYIGVGLDFGKVPKKGIKVCKVKSCVGIYDM